MEKKIEELINELKSIKDNEHSDAETDHMKADEILCDIIAEYGHPEVKDIFDKINKYYI